MATRIKRYEDRADRFDDLLERIEAEMGPEAEIEKREFRRGRFLGLFGGERMVEVIATVEVDSEGSVRPERNGAAPVERLLSEPPAGPTLPDAPAARHIDLEADQPISAVLEQALALNPPPAETAATAEAAAPAESQAESAPDPELAPGAKVEVAPAQIRDLQQSIAELQQTMQQFLEQQRVLIEARVQPGEDEETAGKPASNQGVLFPEDPEHLPADQPSAAELLALDRATGLSSAQRQVYDHLLDWNIGPCDAMELLNKALDLHPNGNAPAAEELLQDITREICRNILLSGGIKLRKSPPAKVVALVGATGVGKTTTIAKLAAHFCFNEGKRVSLLSLDNYRIAAAEQLRTYTDIMGIDLDIVFSRDEFDGVLTGRSQNDLILIDTAGRSPLNDRQIYELKEIFSARPPDEVHLVVAAPTKADDLRLILENFAPLGYDHIIVSKLDETRSLGGIYNITRLAGRAGGNAVPISYFTVGQSVPEDIRAAQPGFIQAWIEQGKIL